MYLICRKSSGIVTNSFTFIGKSKQVIFLRIIGIFLLGTISCTSQYVFNGQIAPDASHKTVYLSLVENYRKTSRVYADQILMETQADSLGYFQFKGDNLSDHNSIYRIHTDDCNENANGGSHFFRECSNSKSILFIAKKGDTIRFPLLQNNQPFCEITSTNKASELLLKIDAFKEEMILDFMEYESKASLSLNLTKWFNRFQRYGETINEPLAELYVYDLLSDRRNETYTYYLQDVQSNEYYQDLKNRLQAAYPNSPFTLQFEQEVNLDQALVTLGSTDSQKSFATYLFYGGGALLILFLGYFVTTKRKKQFQKKAIDTLTQQELNILNAIRKEKTNKEIATELFISLSTVKTHINNIYKKLNIGTRADVKDMF